MLKIQYESYKIYMKKKIDILLNEVSNNEKIGNELILNETLNTINEEINIIINNNIKIFDNQLKMKLEEKIKMNIMNGIETIT